MKPNNNILDRLLRSAASAPVRELGEPDWSSEARALAAWRSARSCPEETSLLPLPMLRRALALSVVAAAAVLIGVGYDRVDSGRDPVEISNAAVSSTVISLALR